MTDLHQLIATELKQAECCHVDRFPPFYNCSIGAHLLNLENKTRANKTQHIYYEGRRVPDLRAHIMFLAPPGGEKTFWQEQYLRGEQALLSDSGVEITMKGMMSEAGFVGTVRLEQGMRIETQGICKRHQAAIAGIEEFSAVSNALQMQHSSNLDPALLGALDSGWIYKDLAAGPIDYETYLTLWCGTQPARFDLRSGMARRFLFINFIPNSKDLQEIKIARRKSKNLAYNPIMTDRIRKEVRALKQRLGQLQKIIWDDAVYQLYDEYRLLHWEEQLYDHLLLGYIIMKGTFDSELFVTIDEESKKLILKEAQYRDMIRRGSEFAEVLMIMREHAGEMGLFELKDELLSFGKDWRQSRDLIDEMVRMRALQRTSDNRIKLAAELRGEKNVR